jgi:Tfp pilus assembly protein PilF
MASSMPPAAPRTARSVEEWRIEAEAHRLAGRLDEAEQVLARILQAMPDYHPVLHQAAILSSQRKRPQEALARFERALQLAPDRALYHRNIGELFRKQSRLDDAIAHARRAVELTPDDAAAHYDLGVVLHDRLEIDQAMAALRRTLALDPSMATAHLGLAELLLLTGRFEEGWREYEWRLTLPGAPPLLPPTDRPAWDGAPLPNGTLLLICDQGFGDMIQFARYIPAAAERCRTLVLACSAEMQPIIGQQPGIAGCFDHWQRVPPFDAYCSLSSLPRLFGTDGATIPAPGARVTADPAKAERWRRRLDTLIPAGYRRIGLVWAGRPTHLNDFNRSMSLQSLGPLARLDRVALISLQMGPAQGEIARYYGAAPLINLGAEIGDFTDTMAILDGIDRLVAVDTGVAHLAGAMGKPVSILLPHAPDWRWQLDRTDSPWYPTATLCRQRRPGDWAGAVEAMLETIRT